MGLQLDLDFFSPSSPSAMPSDNAGPSLKTSQDFSAATAGKTLELWLEHYVGRRSMYLPMDGKMPVLLSARKDSSNGVLWMRNTVEYRSGAVACSLSAILETGPVDRRYYLSAKACRGILRRAAKRGKELPVQLAAALKAVADSEQTSNLTAESQ